VEDLDTAIAMRDSPITRAFRANVASIVSSGGLANGCG
jgi:hypothetical protein